MKENSKKSRPCAVLYSSVEAKLRHGTLYSQEVVKTKEAALKWYCKICGINAEVAFIEDHNPKNRNHPEWRYVIGYILMHHIDLVVIERWRNLGPQLKLVLLKLDELKRLGIDIICMDEPLDFNWPDSRKRLEFYVANEQLREYKEEL